MGEINRRTFLRRSVAAGSAASACLSLNSLGNRVLGANDRFRIGICGLNGRGKSHLKEFTALDNVEVAYLVDPDAKVLAKAQASLNEQLGGSSSAKGVADVRTVLDDSSIDAISVAAPNHWHTLMVIWAAQSRKHCYVEKPACHDIREGRVAVEAWKKYGVVVQHGTQRRSDSDIAGLHEAIRAGKFGRLVVSYGYACKPRQGIGFQSPAAPPSELDWNLWRGPAKVEQFHANLVHYNWHWFWQTGNGELNNQGTHQLDVAQWALDEGAGHPVRAMALGGRFSWKDQGETPNTMFAVAEYANGQQVFFNVRNVNYDGYDRQVENEYYFEDGGRIIREEYYPAGSEKGEKISLPPGKVTPGGAFGSFVSACRAGNPKMSNADMEIAHYSCVLGHIMNLSYRLGKPMPFNAKAGRFGDNQRASEHFLKLHGVMKDGCGILEDKENYIVGPWLTFDGAKERFVGDHAEEANALLQDPHREGFQVPAVDKV